MTLPVGNLGTRFGEGRLAFETTRLRPPSQEPRTTSRRLADPKPRRRGPPHHRPCTIPSADRSAEPQRLSNQTEGLHSGICTTAEEGDTTARQPKTTAAHHAEIVTASAP